MSILAKDAQVGHTYKTSTNRIVTVRGFEGEGENLRAICVSARTGNLVAIPWDFEFAEEVVEASTDPVVAKVPEAPDQALTATEVSEETVEAPSEETAEEPSTTATEVSEETAEEAPSEETAEEPSTTAPEVSEETAEEAPSEETAEEPSTTAPEEVSEETAEEAPSEETVEKTSAAVSEAATKKSKAKEKSERDPRKSLSLKDPVFLDLLAQGLKAREIADRMDKDPQTVSVRIYHLKKQGKLPKTSYYYKR